MEHLYSEVEDVKSRLEQIDVIGAPCVFFDDEDDDDYFDDELDGSGSA